jgi:hypothetical protein
MVSIVAELPKKDLLYKLDENDGDNSTTPSSKAKEEEEEEEEEEVKTRKTNLQMPKLKCCWPKPVTTICFSVTVM